MFSRYSLCVIRWICAFAIAAGAQSAVAAPMATGVPGAQAFLRAPISPADAEKLISKRKDQGGQNTGIRAATGKVGSASAALIAPSAPIPASIAELARALKYDPVLIYEFVHNNIEYLPIWGMLKGPEGALTDGSGTAFDIAQLTADLINTNPAPGTSATLVRGTVRISGANAASWIRLNGMNICPLAYSFSGGLIPTSFAVTGYPNCTGGNTSVTIGHVWVKVVIGGITYEIDPSFKTHTAVSPSVNLTTVTGYNRSSFLAAACGGSCNTNPNIVTIPNANRASILNPASTHSYPKYARNLLSYLQTNNIHDLNQVIGGYKSLIRKLLSDTSML